MSSLKTRMTALTGGNTAPTAKLAALFGPDGLGSGNGTNRSVEANPDLRHHPELG